MIATASLRTSAGLAGLIFAGALALPASAAPPKDAPPAAKEVTVATTFDRDAAGRLAELALACVHKEYPNKIAHVLNGDADVKPPRELTPAFYGCYDWHSAVHGHWLLARLLRQFPDAPFAARARAALDRSLTPENIATEVRYLQAAGRTTFERPYGLAWLLQLAAELHEQDPRDDPQARRWAEALDPLARASAERIRSWAPKLSFPIRTGEHNQTAFGFGLILDWARSTGDRQTAALLEGRIRDLYLKDRDCPIEYEPSGEDFLSPCLGEADLVRRVLAPEAYAEWLSGFLPRLPKDGRGDWLTPGIVTDPTDGKLAHLDGLNLSRAWMLEGIAAGLPAEDPRSSSLRAAAAAHRESGLRSVTGEHYEG
ncbi:MAG TPA: DUF2891 domain-containing protein, partial [Thermoanaerobaculia bacterium]|nr:DUF2891 domain-containing protein [Thermoanaerobaculia bacterium]